MAVSIIILDSRYFALICRIVYKNSWHVPRGHCSIDRIISVTNICILTLVLGSFMLGTNNQFVGVFLILDYTRSIYEDRVVW